MTVVLKCQAKLIVWIKLIAFAVFNKSMYIVLGIYFVLVLDTLKWNIDPLKNFWRLERSHYCLWIFICSGNTAGLWRRVRRKVNYLKNCLLNHFWSIEPYCLCFFAFYLDPGRVHQEHGCSDVEHLPDCGQPGAGHVLCYPAATVPTTDREIGQPACCCYRSSDSHHAGAEGTAVYRGRELVDV